MRRIAVVAAIALALGGCADTDDGTDDAAATPSEASPAASATASGTRTIAHEKGSTEVPADPQRVVVLDGLLLDFALSLDVTPVGAVRTDAAGGLPDYLGDRVEGVEIVGEIKNPNLEAIAAQQPDLILSAVLSDEELYDDFSRIAPTVMVQGAGSTWRTDFPIVAEALGQAEEAEELLAEFDAAAAEVGEAVGAAGKTASIVRFLADQTRVYGPDSFSGGILRSIGFDAPDLDYSEFSIAMISPEQIELADGDVIFATSFGPADESTRSSVTSVWGGLRAIEAGCQFDVSDETWMVGIGLISAREILDDVERLVTDADCGS